MAETVKDHGESNWSEEMFKIRLAVSLRNFGVDKAVMGHAWLRGGERQIDVSDMEHGLQHRDAKIISGEPAGSRINKWGKLNPDPTRKIATWGTDGRPVCLVVALLRDGYIKVVTVHKGEHGGAPNREPACR